VRGTGVGVNCRTVSTIDALLGKRDCFAGLRDFFARFFLSSRSASGMFFGSPIDLGALRHGYHPGNTVTRGVCPGVPRVVTSVNTAVFAAGDAGNAPTVPLLVCAARSNDPACAPAWFFF
jgi:hypothetical protein